MKELNRTVQELVEIYLRVRDLVPSGIHTDLRNLIFFLIRPFMLLDLTPIVTIDRRVRLPLSQERGHGLDFFSVRMHVGFPSPCLV
jgi:hypothetical protein